MMDSHVMARYLYQEHKNEPLSAEEEIRLVKRYRRGDEEARQRLIESNIRFVIKLALNYRKQGMNLADLIQEGTLGLIEALEKFDLKKKCRLITYASWWIRLYMQRSIEQKTRQVNLPINKLEMLRKLRNFESQYAQHHGRQPGLEDCANYLQIDENKVRDLIEHSPSFQTLHARDEEHPGIETVLIDDTRPDVREEIWSQEADHCLQSMMNQLTPREREVIFHRFNLEGEGKKLSLRKVGEKMGLSAEGVRRIEEQAMTKLRRPVWQDKLASLFAA